MYTEEAALLFCRWSRGSKEDPLEGEDPSELLFRRKKRGTRVAQSQISCLGHVKTWPFGFRLLPVAILALLLYGVITQKHSLRTNVKGKVWTVLLAFTSVCQLIGNFTSHPHAETCYWQNQCTGLALAQQAHFLHSKCRKAIAQDGTDNVGNEWTWVLIVLFLHASALLDGSLPATKAIHGFHLALCLNRSRSGISHLVFHWQSCTKLCRVWIYNMFKPCPKNRSFLHNAAVGDVASKVQIFPLLNARFAWTFREANSLSHPHPKFLAIFFVQGW